MNDWQATLLTIAGTAVGAAASWFISRWYYRRSGVDLDAALQPLAGDNQKLLRAMNAVGHMLEQSGIGRPTYDAAGNLTGVVVTCTLLATESDDIFQGTATVTPPSQYDRQHEQPAPENQDGHHA